MSSQYKKALVVLLLLLSIGAGVTYFVVKNAGSEIKQETVALFSNPEGEEPYTDLLGNPIALEQYLGRTLVVATWASWSPFSTGDLKMLSELRTEFSSDEVVFMAINRKETKEQAARFLQTVPEVSGVVMVLDPRDAFYLTVGGYAMPEVVVYNSRGEVAQHYRGVTNIDDLRQVIQGILSQETQ